MTKRQAQNVKAALMGPRGYGQIRPGQGNQEWYAKLCESMGTKPKEDVVLRIPAWFGDTCQQALIVLETGRITFALLEDGARYDTVGLICNGEDGIDLVEVFSMEIAADQARQEYIDAECAAEAALEAEEYDNE